MITLTSGDVVVMPTWVFAFFLIGGVAIIAYLLWACDISQRDLRHERRRRVVHDHLHHNGPAPQSLFLAGDPAAWTADVTKRAERAVRDAQGGGR